METKLLCSLVQDITGSDVPTTVVRTHAQVCTLKELTGRVDVGERSFAFIA